MTILLVRHAESAGNANETLYGAVADQAMILTPRGHEQARALGMFLKEWYRNNSPEHKVRLWCSPYQRALLTVMEMKDSMGEWAWDKCGRGHDIHFDDRLREKDWGYYRVTDYNRGGKLEREQPDLYKHYRMVRDAPMGRYFSRPVGGESIADVADRMRSFFHDLHFDIERGIKDHLIMAHGASVLAFVYAFTKTHPIFMDQEKLPNNTSVRLIDIDPVSGRYMDYGTIFDAAKNIYLTEKPAQPVLRDLERIIR